MKKYIYVVMMSLIFFSCDKFLDIAPKGKQLLSTVEDYDQWLNDESLVMGLASPYCSFNYLGDNVDMVNLSSPPSVVTELMYTWGPQFSLLMNEAPVLWGDHYAKINLYNTVLLGIDKATGGTPAQVRTLKAEALLGRSLEYFYLLNEYSKPYDVSTADSDLAVPFVTSNDVTQVVPGRSTVAQIYKQVIEDLKAAIPNLPNDNTSNRFRGSKAAAYSVLARTYFYASDYKSASEYAALALANSRATMIDFNGTLPTSNLLSIQADVIYGRMVIGSVYPSLDFMRSFGSNDLRVRKLYYSTDGYTFTQRGATLFMPAYTTPAFTYSNTGTSVQEMKLIVSECAVRDNNIASALKELDEVRKNRINKNSYVPFDSDSQEAVLIEVLKERGHELAFNGLRWFDMRRLDKEGRMKTVHRYNAKEEIVATLEPGSNQYTLRIPSQVLIFNPGMPQNP